MITIIEEIIDKIKDKNHIIVFPSEISANFWQKKITDYLEQGIVCLDQFISWDKFKSRVFTYKARGRPVNNTDRLIFLNHFFKQNREKLFIKTIIPLEFAGNAAIFLNQFIEFLPELSQLSLDKEKSGKKGINQGKKADLLLLKNHYTKYLNSTGLYEPRFLIPVINPGNRTFLIIYPGIARDYHYYQKLIRDCPAITEVSLADSKTTGKIQVFENTLHEIDQVLTSIAALLDQGVDPAEIAVTAANLPEIEEYIRLRATIHEIPLYIHSGKPVLEYKEMIWLKHIKECYQAGFAFTGIKKLFTNQAVPWKNRSLARRLVQFGIQYKCILGETAQQDTWLVSFEKAAQVKDAFFNQLAELTEYYRTLKSSIKLIYESADLNILEANLRQFSRTFLIQEIWIKEKFRIFQFSLDQLGELAVAATRLPTLTLDNPFETWLQYLAGKQYVKEIHTTGIAVYPYRVSAGIYPAYHFIINASQKGTKYIIKHYPYLSLDEEAGIKNPETDLSEAYLKLYTHSGRTVCFSYARKSFRDTNIVPGYFISTGEIQEAIQQDTSRDLYRSERKFWDPGGKNSINLIYRTQFQSINRAFRTLFSDKTRDFTRQDLPRGKLKDLILEKITKNGILLISPSGLEQYANCAFAYLLFKAVRLEELEFQPVMINHRDLGLIMHRIFQEFYTRVNALHDPVISAGNVSIYKNMMGNTCREVLTEYTRMHPLPVAPCWNQIRHRITDHSMAFVTAEIENFSGFATTATEIRLQVLWPDKKIQLTGKLDRTAAGNGCQVVIDYKKRNSPSQKEIFSDEPVSFQMPFYIYLLEQTRDINVDIAAYYIIEKEKYQYVIHPQQKAMAGRSEMEAAVSGMKEAILKFADQVQSGSYRVPGNLSPASCQYCSYRGVCRRKYLTG